MNIRLFYRRSFTASCTDVIGRYTVAVHKRISNRCSCTEFNRNRYADIL